MHNPLTDAKRVDEWLCSTNAPAAAIAAQGRVVAALAAALAVPSEDAEAKPGTQEVVVVLHHREADAVLAVLEQAINARITPGVGLRVEDAHAAGVKIELAMQGVSFAASGQDRETPDA